MKNTKTSKVTRNLVIKMMSTYSTKQIRTDHKDLIQDIAFDFYGKRVATASLDQSVKIWNINEKGDWIVKEELKVYCRSPH